MSNVLNVGFLIYGMAHDNCHKQCTSTYMLMWAIEKENEFDSNVATGLKFDVDFHSSVGLSPYVILETLITRIRGPPTRVACSRR